MKIEVAAYTFLYNGPKVPAWACVFSSESFVNDDGETVVGGSDPSRMRGYVKRVAVTGSAGVWEVAAFSGANEIDSNTDSVTSLTRATYTLAIFSATGTLLTYLGTGLKVSEVLTPTTWAAIIEYTSARQQPYRAAYYDTNAIDRLLDPIQEDIIALEAAAELHLNGYDTLALAIAGIGATPADLFINQAITVSSNTVIPSTCRLVPKKGAVITIASGVTLTVGSMVDIGNTKIFAGDGHVLFGEAAAVPYRTAWWTGPTDGVSIDTALAKAFLAATAQVGTRIVIPKGVWLTAGNIEVPDHTVIEGEADEPLFGGTSSDPTGTVLQMTATNAPVFLFDSTIKYSVTFRGIVIDGNALANVTGVLCESGSSVVHNLWFYAVEIRECHDGFRVNETSAVAMTVRARFDRKCQIVYNTNTAMRINCEDTIIEFCGTLGVGTALNGSGILTEGAGAGYMSFRDAEMGGALVGGPGSGGTRQIIKQIVVAPSGITTSGLAKCVVTKAGMPGSPLTVQFAVTTTEHTSDALIARAAARALAQNTTIMEYFNVGWPGSVEIYMQPLDPEANDPTFNLTIEDDTSVGITDDVTSSIEVAGDAGVSGFSESLFQLEAPIRQLYIYGTWIESVRRAINVQIPDVGTDLTGISIHGGYLGAPIYVAGGSGGHINLNGVLMHVKGVRVESGAEMSVRADNKTGYIDSGSYDGYGWEQRPTNAGMFTTQGLHFDGTSREEFDSLTQNYSSRVKIVRNSNQGSVAQDPWLQVLTPNNAGKHLRLAALNASQQWVGYDIYRSTVDGLLYIEGNQGSPFNGIYVTGTSRFVGNSQFDANVAITGTLGVTGRVAIYDQAYTAQALGGSSVGRMVVGSTVAQAAPDGFVGLELYAKVQPTSSSFKIVSGLRNYVVLDGALATNSLGVWGNYTSITSTAGWTAPPLADVYGSISSVDIGAQNGFTSLTGYWGVARIGSINAGNGTTVRGVYGQAVFGYASNVTDVAGVQSQVFGGSGAFGGVATHVAGFHATRDSLGAAVTNFYGVRVGPYAGSVTFTPTNVYGIHIDSTASGFGTNNWAIKSDSTEKSVFAGKIEVPTVAYSSTTWAGADAASVPRRDEINTLVKDQHMPNLFSIPGGIEGAVAVTERVECTTGAQLLYTVPTGYIFVGAVSLSNPTAGAITAAQTIFTISGNNYASAAADASIASKDMETTGGASLLGPLPAGATITQNAAAAGLVAIVRGVLIPTALNPRVKLLLVNPTNVRSTVYATAANKRCVSMLGIGSLAGLSDAPISNNVVGSGGSTVTLSMRPTGTAYNAVLHDYRNRSPVDTAATTWSVFYAIPPDHTVEILSSVATAGQLFRVLMFELDA